MELCLFTLAVDLPHCCMHFTGSWAPLLTVQCASAIKKANTMLGYIRNGVVNNTEPIIMPLYKSTLWPQLEYCAVLVMLSQRKDIAEMEGIQKRAMRMIKGMEMKK